MKNRKQRKKIERCMFTGDCDLKLHSSRRGTYCKEPEYACNQKKTNYKRIQRILKFLNG